MRKILIIIVVFIFSNKNVAQTFELEKVTKEQLEQKRHPNDSSAVAAILFKKNNTKFVYDYKNGFTLKSEFTIKIKIYKKEGLEWANFEIPYFVGYQTRDDEIVNIKKAFTYNLVNGKIDKKKVSSDGKFKKKVNELWQTKIITFPDVKEGSIIELKYELISQNLSELPVFQFQYKIPVDYAQNVTFVPGFYIYKAIQLGYINVFHDDKLEEGYQDYDDQYGHSNALRYQQIKTNYEVADVPGLIEEDYVSNMDDFFGKIEYELQTTQFPNEKPKQMASTWENVATSIYEDKTFGAELNKTSYFINDLKRIIDKIDSKEERLKTIYEFVKNKMSWNDRYGYYTSKGVETAYLENSGNVAEINLILTSMLKMAGLEASPVLLSTRDNGIALFPNRSKFNYVIASVVLDGKQILLDATDKFASINILPTRDLNNKGRLINKDGSSVEIDLSPKYNSNDIISIVASIDKQGEMTGQVREQYFDYNALYFRHKYAGLTNESLIEKLEKKYPGIEIESYEIKNEKAVYEPVTENYTFKSSNEIELIGDKMFFSPMLFFKNTENPFKQETRQFPVDFLFPTKDKYIIIINIPDGYKIESVPKSNGLNINDKYLAYDFKASNTEKQITINVTFDINVSVIPQQHYDALQKFYKIMIERQNEKIVLKKI